ncbi:hypothetical protein ACRTDM_08810 [Shewanella algae]|uniref:Uncharacterized protein n=2 Tax=Bacteria TaxID=2 RepID=A0AAU6VSJ6_UNCXX|nr:MULTISPECIES: hypothetical protein [Shewanella]MDE0565580.1 hypothetical protein [Shewanella sp. K8]
MQPNSDGKYIVKVIDFKSVFLPSPADVLQLLGLPNNFVKLIPSLEDRYDQPLRVSRSSRAEMSKKGVARPTIKKLLNWFEFLPIPIKRFLSVPHVLKTRRAMNVGSNAGLWNALSYGYRISAQDDEFTLLLDFIDARAKVDYQMVKSIKSEIRKGVIKENDLNAIWLAQVDIWIEYSGVPADQLVFYSLYAASENTQFSRSEKENSAILKAFFHLFFDFYFSAIAHYELGLSLYYMRCGAKEIGEPHRSFFSSVINGYNDNGRACFSSMLSELRTILAKNELGSSWRSLAAYIDIDESGECAETLNDKQYKQLKDWRNGKNMPSANKLRKFVSNYMNALGGNDVDSVLIYLRIARGIDELVVRLCEQVKDESVVSIIAEVLAEYPKYFERYKQNLV